MTRYEIGFLTKCAELGVSRVDALRMAKRASDNFRKLAAGQQDRRRSGGGHVLAPLALAGLGGGTAYASNAASNLFEEAGFGRHPVLDKDVVAAIERYADSGKGNPRLADYLYNYAITGHDAIRRPAFVGSLNQNSAQDMYQVTGLAGKKILDKLKIFKASPFGKKILANPRAYKLFRKLQLIAGQEAINGGYIRTPRVGSAVEHYASFATDPVTAYIKMMHEYKPAQKVTIGELADDILEAKRNFANPGNSAGRAFATPEQYFTWKHRDGVLSLSGAPLRSDFTSEKNFRRALREYRKTGNPPVFNELMDAVAHANDRNSMIGALNGIDGVTDAAAEKLGKKTLIQAFTEQIGDMTKINRLPNSTRYTVTPGVTKFRDIVDLRAHRTPLQKFLDPLRAASNGKAERHYAVGLNFGKIMTNLAKRRVKALGLASAAAGLGLAGYGVKRNIDARRSRR